jgi:uncharacterized protein YjiK
MRFLTKNIVLFILLYVFSAFLMPLPALQTIEAPSVKKITAFDSLPPDSSSPIEIIKKWEIPAELKSISGMDFIDNTHIACISNETGAIVIYNIESGEIEARIAFAPTGDYEAIALVGETAYIGCADGRLYEVAAYRSEQPAIKEYGTHLTLKQSLAGLCYDRQSDRLLAVIKGRESGTQLYKGIYAFDLSTKKMAVSPVFRINLQDTVFPKQPVKNLQYVLQPSEIAIAEDSGDMYITDGARSQLLILNSSGDIKKLCPLSKTDFNQPEGISFTPTGDIYICNAGDKDFPGTLVRLSIKGSGIN